MKQFLLSLFSWLLLLATAPCSAQNPPYKSVNLGNWLVAEGWMNRSLFDSIPNKDLLDGTQLQIKSTSLNRYFSAEGGGGSVISANRTNASTWETFRLWRINETTFNFRVANKNFIGLTRSGDGKTAVAVAIQPALNETFVVVRNSSNPLRFKFLAANGFYLQAQTGDTVRADYVGSPGDWSDQNPSVFLITIVGTLLGEYQLTNGYGTAKAPSVLTNHWNTYITADDFRLMSQNGLTAARIPVGWWIIYDPTPPKPFVGGSLQALDSAFTWAQQYSMKIIVDLHAAPGSQNGYDHSGTRDGYQEWGAAYIPQTVAVIDFLAKRYANKSSLAAIELLNEPLSPGANLTDLTTYYKQGYAAVRKYSSSVYVMLASRVASTNNTELLPLANSLSRSVLDVHYYSVFDLSFITMNAQQNIDYIYNQRLQMLKQVTPANGTLSFVGEWAAEWLVQGASMADYQRFAKAQIETYGNATFGWAYWSYKCQENHWSLYWMVAKQLHKVELELEQALHTNLKCYLIVELKHGIKTEF